MGDFDKVLLRIIKYETFLLALEEDKKYYERSYQQRAFT